MNYTYKHTQFELHTECVSSEVKERMRARGFDFDVDEIRHAYVVTKGGDPIKMAPVAGRPGAYRVSTYVANNEWWFAVESQATGAEKMYEEVGDETASPGVGDEYAVRREGSRRNVRSRTRRGSARRRRGGVARVRVVRLLVLEQRSTGGGVHDGDVRVRGGAKANGGPKGAEERFHEPGYPPDSNTYLTAPVDADGMMILPDGVSSGILVEQK